MKDFICLVEKGLVRLYVSEDVLAEVEEVLSRPEIRTHFPPLTDEVIGAFLLRLRNIAQSMRHVPKKFSYSRDPDDEPYINLAVETKADYLVSRDRDLLDLMTAYSSEAKEFRQRFRPLRVIEPLEFLQEVRRLESESAAS